MPTESRTTDWYNKNAKKYSKGLKTDDGVFHHSFEKPAMYSHLPDLTGKKVLCIACGSGEEVAYLKAHGAQRAVGVDLSEGLIELAKGNHPDCEFSVMDMEKLEFEEESFDFVYSSLALHYLPNWDKVMQSVHKVLKPNGEFLFSSSHPAADAMKWDHSDDSIRQLTLSARVTKNSEDIVTQGSYHTPRKIEIQEGFAVTFYHQKLESIFKSILDAGFLITGLWEPKPTEKMRKISPHNYALWSELPWLIIIKLQKPD